MVEGCRSPVGILVEVEILLEVWKQCMRQMEEVVGELLFLEEVGRIHLENEKKQGAAVGQQGEAAVGAGIL